MSAGGLMAVKSIAVCVTARPSWAKLQPVVQELRSRGYLVDLIACAYALLHHYGSVHELMKADGMPPTCKIYAAFEGTTHETAAMTTGALTEALARRFAHTKPDLVIVCADRHETLAVSIAASYQNIPLLHLQGGEHSGSIDDKVRWANTMLADGHAVSHQQAADAVRHVLQASTGLDGSFFPSSRLKTVRATGCPSIDAARVALTETPVCFDELGGVGPVVDPFDAFAVVAIHPDTTEALSDYLAHWAKARDILAEHNLPAVVFWPGADAHASEAAKWLRSESFRTRTHYVRSLPPRRFLRLLSQAKLTIGNSSAFVREGQFLAVPTIRLGHRQDGRRDSHNYGDGFASKRIADLVAEMLA